MIAGTQIAEALSKLIGNGGYDPGIQTGSRRLPQTMRQLIDGDFEIEDTSMSSDSARPQLNLNAGLCRRNVFAPIRARQLSIKRATPPAIKDDDYRGYYALLSSFYAWLKRKRKIGKINIDHNLEDKPWPLWDRFEQEINERTGYHACDFFPQEEWQECDTDDPQDWGAAWMPLYNMEYEEDAAPLLEFLCRFQGDIVFPEAVFEGRDPEQINNVLGIMQQIIKRKKYDTLPEEWANAYRALEKYRSGLIAYTEPDETKMDIENADDIERFFKAAKEVAEMINGTLPLVKLCRANSEKFWDNLIEHLIEIPIRKKKKLKPQPLIQVFANEQKIQIRV